jgi:hypothetical protein
MEDLRISQEEESKTFEEKQNEFIGSVGEDIATSVYAGFCGDELKDLQRVDLSIRIFLSSTFTDTSFERNFLMSQVRNLTRKALITINPSKLRKHGKPLNPKSPSEAAGV